ncbi:hypothetical protein SESBI_20529 [Sesbania bispinosa]|nr:hypothetical protein SESBI_20529 [Sesbania bispinosa]
MALPNLAKLQRKKIRISCTSLDEGWYLETLFMFTAHTLPPPSKFKLCKAKVPNLIDRKRGMGCVSSNLLNHDEEFAQLSSSALGHHIVSLTSTIYGLLTLDPPHTPSTTPPSRFTLSSLWSEHKPLRSEPEVVNSWELMTASASLPSLHPNPSHTTTLRGVRRTFEACNA